MTIGIQAAVKQTEILGSLELLDDHRARPHAEPDATAAILIIRHSAEPLRADHHHIFINPRFRQTPPRSGVCRWNPLHAAGKIECRRRIQPGRGGHEAGSELGNAISGVDRAADDQIEVLGFQAGRLKRLGGGVRREGRGRFVRAGDAPFPDARAAAIDPLVVGIDPSSTGRRWSGASPARNCPCRR